MTNSYITDRYFVELVREACRRLDIACTFYSDDWIAKLSSEKYERYIFGYNFDINTAAATAVAADKVATYEVLASKSIPAVEHYLLRSRASNAILKEKIGAISDNQAVVIKPLSGTSGHGVHFEPTKQAAYDYVEAQTHSDWAISPYYDIALEKRVIILDGEVLLSYDKIQDSTAEGMRHFNLAKGAIAQQCRLTQAEKALALQAQQALNLRLAVVDIVELKDASQMIMEVNTGLMMEYFARFSNENYATAQTIYDRIIETMMQ